MVARGWREGEEQGMLIKGYEALVMQDYSILGGLMYSVVTAVNQYRHTLLYIKLIINKDLLYSTGNCT